METDALESNALARRQENLRRQQKTEVEQATKPFETSLEEAGLELVSLEEPRDEVAQEPGADPAGQRHGAQQRHPPDGRHVLELGGDSPMDPFSEDSPFEFGNE